MWHVYSKSSAVAWLECSDDLLLRQGSDVVVAVLGWVAASEVVALVVIEVLGY